MDGPISLSQRTTTQNNHMTTDTMDHDFSDARPSEIEFKKSIFRNDHSEVFLVQIRGTTCVMKVHRDSGPVPFPVERQTGIHKCEVRAYRQLIKHGLCHQGIVPRYYGEINPLNLNDYQPHLERFLEENLPPGAVFLEYIPNMVTIRPEHYTKERVDSMIHGIRQIHKASILHFDTYPRNIKIFEDDPARVLWIDFDRAQTYNDEYPITDRNKEWIKEEEEDMLALAEALEYDHAHGKMWKSLQFY